VNDHHSGPNWLAQAVESIFAGLGYASALGTLSVFLVGSFLPQDLPSPYWERLRWLRTDTFGFSCFIVAALTITLSEYLRLSRITRRAGTSDPTNVRAGHLFTLVVARSLVVAGSALVVYLSVNAVTHPNTLLLPATHLLSWPTESTLRAIALIVTACAFATARTQRIALGAVGLRSP
jgi:hypothetical protein